MGKSSKKVASRSRAKSGVGHAPVGFSHLLNEIKTRIQQSQVRAILAVNAELVRLYWDIGRMIDQRQKQEGWGAAVIPRLARELRNEMPEIKGFSERNIDRMIAFYRAYPTPSDFSPQPVAKFRSPEEVPQVVAKLSAAPEVRPPGALSLDSFLWSVPWAHHVVLIEKVKDLTNRLWYMRQALANGWSRNVLLVMIQSEAHLRQGKALTNSFLSRSSAPGRPSAAGCSVPM